MTFSPDVEHEGVALTRGARRVVAVFTDECSKKAAPERCWRCTKMPGMYCPAKRLALPSAQSLQGVLQPRACGQA